MIFKEIYYNKAVKDIILDKMPKKAFVSVRKLHQYAEGITGANRDITIYVNEGGGFKTKKEARDFFKEIKEKDSQGYKNKLIKKTQYGDIGTFYKIEFLKGTELVETLDKYDSHYNIKFLENIG